MKQYDVVVIGAGSGGLTSAVGFAKVGKKVLLIEREHMGGECTNTGCIPSKALLHHAKSYYHAQQIAGKSVMSEEYRRNAFQYVRETIDHILAEETPEVFEKMGIDVVMGEAEFNDKCSVTVAKETYRYKTAIIATGSRPRELSVDGLSEADILTNQNIFTLTDVPKRLLVIGAGPIGMEIAEAFAMLGSTVTIATIDETFARLEDPAIHPIIRETFDELGITIKTNAHITGVEHNTARFEQRHNEQVEGTFTVPFDKVLVAIGRTPNLPQGLTTAGIASSTFGVTVDSQFRTTNKHVYAVGDCAGRLKFTHTADDTARQIVTRVVSKGLLRVKQQKAVPKVTYTSPEMAQVGLSEKAAIERYGATGVRRVEVPFSTNDRAKTEGSTEGLLIVLARPITGRILGAHIVHPRAGEILPIFTLAIDEDISLWKLQKSIVAYPTYAQIVKKAGDYFVGTQIASLKKDLLNLIKRNAVKISAALIWGSLLYFLAHYKAAHMLSVSDISLLVFDVITMTALGPLVYVLFYVIRPITFFPATALTILSGVFFGFLWGTILTVFAATLSSAVAYGVGRFFGKGWRLEEGVLGSFVTAVRENSFTSVLTARLIFMPFDIVSYAAGILKAKFMPFILATLIGIPLGTATFVSIGASLNLETFTQNGFSADVIEPKFLLLSGLVFITSLLVSKGISAWQKKSN